MAAIIQPFGYIDWDNIWSIATLAIGYGAYQKHTEGKLDRQLAGSVAAGIGAFVVADYFGSKWLLENKYPPK
ncbi:uncharacterized protein PV07_08720 [Cladophialophora immunda]|uniref:Uncharacterized protein n=1 Tax=Cladophialophora immunda TaxID=569365 RepID=A0A0D2C2Y7_9EURO|nr:uncharacterized protein PV07_08720 [Cladophialophora immunda]KIW25553.1 hypothetical protein PV07_08720 [Cladophialophora immunda]